MDEKCLETLMARLDVITRLLAHQVALGHETLETRAAVLSSAGLKPKEIAVILGTTPGTVSVRLAEARKKHHQKSR